MMLEDIAREIRKDIMITAYHGKSGHLASAFSAVEIMTALYFGGILRYDKNNPDSFCQPGSHLGGEPKYRDIPGVEATTGSLGHGLSFAVGIALANQLDARQSHTYVLLGDGECQEGSVWEAAVSAAHHRLGRLTVILDRNKLQAMGNTEEILKLDSLQEKWQSFGWDVESVDGHDIGKLVRVLQKDREELRKQPKVIIADTVKGKGVSFMEQVPIWHYRMPNPQEMEIVRKELGNTERELQE